MQERQAKFMEKKGEQSNRYFTKQEMQIASKNLSNLISYEIHYSSTRITAIKGKFKTKMPSVGRDVEELELSYIVGDITNWNNHFGR